MLHFDPLQPYNDLPALPPACDLETKRSLRAAIRANRALAQLKGVGELIPNQSVLVSAVSIQEAQASSEIEGIITTNDNLFRALSQTSDVANDPAAKEAFRYSQALWHGHAEVRAGRRLSTALYEAIVSILVDEPCGVRDVGVHIGNPKREEIIYRPPIGEARLREKLDNLNAYIDAHDDLDPLIKLAAIHYQFEAIHPFRDGNGRTGRIINILYLLQTNLLDVPVLYLSRYVIDHKRDYYRLLRRVTEAGEWEAWVLFLLSAVENTARQTLSQVLTIRDLMADYTSRVRETLPKIYSKELVEQLFARPYCKIGFLVEAGIAKRETASKYLQDLETAGFLEGTKIGREMLYINRSFLNLLKQPPSDLSRSIGEPLEESP